MSDLIERLRTEGKDAFHQKYSLGMFKLCDEAATRIEMLEALLREIDAFDANGNALVTMNYALRCKIRAALEQDKWQSPNTTSNTTSTTT
jgi:hypothetical protein